jgi:histidinol-phosphate aminotransferase
MIVIANPNAPTGICLPVEDIEKIVKSNPDNIVVIDEAYIDFGGESCIPLTAKYDNLLVVQTYSKSRSLAGARLGYAIGNEELIADLDRLRYSTNPYNVNRLTLLMGTAALLGRAYYDSNNSKTIQTRYYTTLKLQELGFEMTDSKANFIFARHPKVKGMELYQELRERGILVRHFDKPRIADFVRITVGTQEQMDSLLTSLKEMLKS